PQMELVDRGIDGSGFYPGAKMCCFGEPTSPPVMILGRDFGTRDYYTKLAAKSGRSEYSLTWRHIDDLYLPSLRNCYVFCTNYLMGVRMDGSAKGDVSERMSRETWISYEMSCWNFLCFQIQQF